MSEKNNTVEQAQGNGDNDVLGDLFGNREDPFNAQKDDGMVPPEGEGAPVKKETNKPEKVNAKEEKKQTESNASVEEKDVAEESPEPEEKSQEKDYKAEFEKSEADREKSDRRYKDSQKWGTDLSKKLSSYEKAVKKYIDDGVLTEDEANGLLDHTKHEELSPEDEPLLIKYSRIWDEGINHMREYADDPKKIDQYTYAFQQLLRDSTSSQEIQDILDEFADIESTPSSYARKLIEIGKKYNDEVFDEVYSAGSVRNYKKKMLEINEDLNKKLDKANKEVEKYKRKYEDFDKKPPMNLPTGSRGDSKSDSSGNESTSSILDSLFSQR